MTQFRYLHALAAYEAALVQSLRLQPTSRNPMDFHELRGTWKGAPVKLSYAFWSGPKVAVARSVRLEGRELEIANLVAVASAPLDAPILGVDLVSARADAGLVVADLSPLMNAGCAVPGLPEWAQAIFSPQPLFVRVTSETAPAALAQVRAMCDRFAGLVDTARPIDPATRRAALERYRDMHLRDERMRSMLANMFGADTAAMVMREVLFPSELVDHVRA